jgi:hypothetical protein
MVLSCQVGFLFMLHAQNVPSFFGIPEGWSLAHIDECPSCSICGPHTSTWRWCLLWLEGVSLS